MKNILLIIANIIGPLWRGPAFIFQIEGKRMHAKLGLGKPRTTITIGNSVNLHDLLIKAPSLTFGEAYMKGDITIDGELMDILIGYHRNTVLSKKIRFLAVTKDTERDGRTVEQAVNNAQHHYDIGNDFYKLWLDPSLTYSCAYFPTGHESLEEAQLAKRELIAGKLNFSKPGLTMLDIGCGWGAMLFHAAKNYQANVTGITPAQEQADYVNEESKRLGLSDKVKVIVGDWRSLDDAKYDRIVSVGMFEHVGQAQYPAFFAKWRSLLRSDGISLLHTIGNLPPSSADPWIDKYIFPGGRLPTEQEIRTGAKNADLRFLTKQEEENLPQGSEGWQNLKKHYASTLAIWYENFSQHKDQVEDMFDEEFYRMWRLYLQGSEAGFRYGGLQLYQAVLLAPEARWEK